MSHEGRMARGKANFDSDTLLSNADTLYYLSHRIAENDSKEKPEVSEKKEEPKKKESKKDDK